MEALFEEKHREKLEQEEPKEKNIKKLRTNRSINN